MTEIEVKCPFLLCALCTFIYLDLPPAMQVDEMKTARPAKPAVVAHQSNLIGHSRATQISAAADNNIAGLSQAGGGGRGALRKLK